MAFRGQSNRTSKSQLQVAALKNQNRVRPAVVRLPTHSSVFVCIPVTCASHARALRAGSTSYRFNAMCPYFRCTNCRSQIVDAVRRTGNLGYGPTGAEQREACGCSARERARYIRERPGARQGRRCLSTGFGSNHILHGREAPDSPRTSECGTHGRPLCLVSGWQAVPTVVALTEGRALHAELPRSALH